MSTQIFKSCVTKTAAFGGWIGINYEHGIDTLNKTETPLMGDSHDNVDTINMTETSRFAQPGALPPDSLNRAEYINWISR